MIIAQLSLTLRRHPPLGLFHLRLLASALVAAMATIPAALVLIVVLQTRVGLRASVKIAAY
jgi:hypothetical protein